MTIRKVLHKTCLAIVMAFLFNGLQGCDPSDKGQFTGPVSGLHYETDSFSGVTNRKGEFRFRCGESIRFYVGDIFLGETIAAKTISPFDLAGIAPPTANAENYLIQHQIVNGIIPPPAMPLKKEGTPFENAVNLAVFLYTIDADMQADNGVQIPADLHDLTVGLEIDFSSKLLDFIYDEFAFKKLLADGRAQGLWGGSRAICNPNIAMDNLYAALELTPDVWAWTSYEIDKNADGVSEFAEFYQYNEDGKMVLFETDSDGDGTINSATTRGFNENGYIVLSESDSDNDGTADSRTTYTRDNNGLVTLQEDDTDGDGTIDSRSTYQYDFYDYEILYEVDDNADGIPELRITNAYDDNGNKIFYARDNNADGTPDSTQSFAFDENGNKTLEEFDNNGDGVIDSRGTYSYDASGNEILYERDQDADGIIDSRSIRTYAENGRPILLERDYNANGIPDMRETYIYDENGTQTLGIIEITNDTDGTILSRTTNSFDEFGNLTRNETESGPGMAMGSLTIFTYNDFGQLLMVESDDNKDGVMDNHVVNTYDENGCLILIERDRDGDGTVDSRTSYTSTPLNRWAPVLDV